MSGTTPQGEPHRPLPDNLPQIPGITLQYEVARGGMGVVYSGRQDFLDRRVAVKLLSLDLGGESFAQRFQREAKILAGIKHPNIVACHMAGTTSDGQSYLVMEFIDGPSLKSWVTKNGPVTSVAALRTTRSVAQALAHAHMLGVIHRDVKPENILLETLTSTAIDIHFPFVPKLVDLGLARMTAETAGLGLTSPGSVMGTPATMSPEQFDDPDSVDFRSDIYGLGCALYEMLVGMPAYRSSKLTDIVMKKRADVAPDPCIEAPEIPAAVGALVQCMLATRREDRPSSYKDLDEQIAAVLKVLSNSTPTRTITGLEGATMPSPSPLPTRPTPSRPTPPAPSGAAAQSTGPGLLRTAELDFLSAGAAVQPESTNPAFRGGSGVLSSGAPTAPGTQAAGAGAAGGATGATIAVTKPNRVPMLAGAAVLVLAAVVWLAFGRGGPTPDEGPVDGPDVPRPVDGNKAPVVAPIEGPLVADLGRSFTLKTSATDPEGDRLIYSWIVPPMQIAYITLGNQKEVTLRIIDGLPDVPFEIAVEVSDGKGNKTRQTHTIKVGACPEQSPLIGFKSNSEWVADAPSITWVDLRDNLRPAVSCRANKSLRVMSGPLPDEPYWEWFGLLQSRNDEGTAYAKVYVRFEFNQRSWAIRCQRDKDKPGEPWSIEVLEAIRSGDQWEYRPFTGSPHHEWFEPEDTEDEYRGSFSVQRLGQELRLSIGEARLPADKPGTEVVSPKGRISVTLPPDVSAGRLTLVVDKGIGVFELKRR